MYSVAPSSPSLKNEQVPCSSVESSFSSSPLLSSSSPAAMTPSHPCIDNSMCSSSSTKSNAEVASPCEKHQSMGLETSSLLSPSTSNHLSSSSLETANSSRKRKVSLSSTLNDSPEVEAKTVRQMAAEGSSSERCESPDSGTITLKTLDAHTSVEDNNKGKISHDKVDGIPNGIVKDSNMYWEGGERPATEGTSRESGKTDEVQDEEVEERFNSDILCQHGKTSSNMS
ncbi:hypothetical protein ElyMa_002831900 [Elysia marginata]|uniref:Uncharacterized protein n=1 Tax=Elysia marginata TaxID=1093978 RepID=A0AAV4HT68_9GAST|nr:hypothetical protein ElyMa_002831900 [Elysia marginata]